MCLVGESKAAAAAILSWAERLERTDSAELQSSSRGSVSEGLDVYR